MKNSQITTVVLICVLFVLVTNAQRGLAEPADKSPILIDTHIGTDISDAFGLGLAFASPDVEIVGITTVGGEAQNRAWMVCRLLTHLERGEIPVAYGRGTQPDSRIDWQIQYRRHPAVVWNRTSKPSEQSAVGLMYEQLKKFPGQVTIVATGPLTNVARLLKQHPDATSLIKKIVVSASPEEIKSDTNAADTVIQSGVSLVVVPAAATERFTPKNKDLERIFAACNTLTYQLQTLYQLWDREHPNLRDALAVMLASGEQFCSFEDRQIALSENGMLDSVNGDANASVVTDVEKQEFIEQYIRRLTEFGRRNIPDPPANLSALIQRDGLPYRVHVYEDYETDIEKRWWMTGKLETEDVPPGSRRACRAVLTQDFDGKMGNTKTTYAAVVFNPVPGPPMGKNTRLSFRYKLTGTDRLRVQLFSLSNGYHRYLSLKDLPRGEWQDATVDMTQMRRPDGSGGSLSEDERIDDIQFYVDPRAELIIDDIVLYDAAPEGKPRPFPQRFLFTGWFDTGKQGQEWPGDFEIVAHEKPLTWDAARSVLDEKTGRSRLRIHMRGRRRLDELVRLRFRYRLAEDSALKIHLVDTESQARYQAAASLLVSGRWEEASADFHIPAKGKDLFADEIQILLDRDAELLVDDLLLYVPGNE